MPLVSIIIPLYLSESYVTDVLRSLCNQSYSNIEIICVIDGSPDNTLSIANACKEKDARIKVLSQSHGGAGAARNTGLNAAKGEYILFLDADDLFPINYVAAMVETAQITCADITICQFYTMDKWNGYILPNSGFQTSKIPGAVTSPAEIKDLFTSISSVIHNKLIWKSLVDQNHLYFSTTESINDVFFSVTAVLCAQKIAFINQNLYTYRVHHNAGSISSNRDKYRTDLFTVFDELYQWLIHNQLTDLYAESFYKLWRNSLRLHLSYGRSKPFADQIAEYLASSEPFCHLSDLQLERKSGLTTASTRVFIKVFRKSDERKKKQYDSILYNMTEIRKELADHWGKHIKLKEPVMRSALWELQDIGINQVIYQMHLKKKTPDLSL